MKTAIAINGAAGRMGQRLVALAREDHDLKLAAALESHGNPTLGKDAGDVAGIGTIGMPIRSMLTMETHVDSIIDFSTPEGTMAVLPTCLQKKIPLVVATTGLEPEHKKKLDAAAHEIAILVAPNMSLAVNVLFELVKVASKLLTNKGFDVEIIERHHRFKRIPPAAQPCNLPRLSSRYRGKPTFAMVVKASLVKDQHQKLASMLSGLGIMSASIRLFSAPWAKPWSLCIRVIPVTVMPGAHFLQLNFWQASPQAVTL